jgi:hypothetical protein
MINKILKLLEYIDISFLKGLKFVYYYYQKFIEKLVGTCNLIDKYLKTVFNSIQFDWINDIRQMEAIL